ncbi:MAG: hypothetical protein CV089_05090 [Nitrospira sp. WS110]|nr:hypothetical protein [Nitrospira sp. WS110]
MKYSLMPLAVDGPTESWLRFFGQNLSVFLREENRPRSAFDFAMNTSINAGGSMPQWRVQGDRGAEEILPDPFMWVKYDER